MEDTPIRLQALTETAVLDVVARDANGVEHATWPVDPAWSSSAEGIATVSQDGVVTARANGEFTAQPLDALDNPVAGVTVVWGIADTLVATLDTTTLVTVTAARPGTTSLSATADSVTGTATVTVTQVADSVAASPDSVTLNAVGDTATLTVAVYDENRFAIAEPDVIWTSSDTLVARVDSLGQVVAVANGTAQIVARSDTAADTAIATDDAPGPSASPLWPRAQTRTGEATYLVVPRLFMPGVGLPIAGGQRPVDGEGVRGCGDVRRGPAAYSRL